MKTLILALGLSLLTVMGQGQNDPDKGQEMTVTGCLQKATSGYTLTVSGGQNYALKSSVVKLDDHVGHRVTVTGKSSTSTDEKGGQKPTGQIDVTKITMVSSTCS